MNSRNGLSASRIRLRTVLASVAILATGLTLSACAPAAHGPGTANPAPSGAHPTPSQSAVAAPTVRIGKSCSELVSTTALTTAIGTSVPSVAPPSDEYTKRTFQQDGALQCNWSDNLASDQLQASNHVSLWVLPDVSVAHWSSAVGTIAEMGETKTALINGDAYGWCNPASTSGTVCEVDTHVGTTWIDLEVESLSKSFASSNLGLTYFATLINPIAADAGLSSFVSKPLWHDPSATAVPATCATTIPDSEIESVSGVSGVDNIGPDLSDQQSLAQFWGVGTNLGVVECDLASSDQQNGFFATVVPGGGWAWSAVQADASTHGGYSAVPSLGPDAVEYTDAVSDGTTIDWVRGGDLCSVVVSLAVPATQAAAAIALATYINGEISS